MAPVKKQKAKKILISPKTAKKVEEVVEPTSEAVVSGQLQKKINKKQQKPIKDPRGVVFIKHLPHGFFEEQLKKYFSQFGNVTRVRLARSTRTGNSKGYAFVEFEYPEVAQVAAETMDNYLMFKKVVKAAYIPPEKQQFNYFRTSVKQIINKSGKKVWVSGKTASIQNRTKQHNDWSEENFQDRTAKQLKKLKKLGEKYAHLGIDINDIIVKPTFLTEEEKKTQNKLKAKSESKTADAKTLKRKPAGKEPVSSNKKENVKKSKKNVSLEDLLGNTIQEDSDDEDYIAMPETEEEEVEANEESSDEETYGFTKDSDNEDDSDVEEEIPQPPPIAKKTKKNALGKPVKKASNVERIDQLVKRKPLTGGVQKLNKKTLKQQPSAVSKSKNALQLTAAKELAKPLPKIKGKPVKSAKPKKVATKVK